MWFVIKGGFWFSLVLIMLPLFDSSSADKLQDGPSVNVADTVSAATQALGYITALCVEKPDVCEKGGETFTALGHRAREGARIAYTFLDNQFGAQSDGVTTGTVAKAAHRTASATDDAPAAVAAVQDEPVKAPAIDIILPRAPVPEPRIEPKHTK